MNQYYDPITLFLMLNTATIALFGSLSSVCDHTCWVKVFNAISSGYGEVPSNGWSGLSSIGTCEAKAITDRTAFDLEPINAWSSLGYNLIGNGLIATALYASNNHE